jgi:hypothetical protein
VSVKAPQAAVQIFFNAAATKSAIFPKTCRGIVPGNVEIGGAALLALSQGADSTKGMQRLTALPPAGMGVVDRAWDAVSVSFDRFCLTAGIKALGTMMEQDAEQACGARHARSDGRRGHRWGRTQGKIGFHAGKVAVERPWVRELGGQELALPSWERAVAEDWLGKWAMNLMLINVSTRKFRRAVRLPEGDVPAPAGAGVSKSAASRHVAGLALASTIFARNVSAAGNERDRLMAKRCVRSSLDIVSVAFGRPLRQHVVAIPSTSALPGTGWQTDSPPRVAGSPRLRIQ